MSVVRTARIAVLYLLGFVDIPSISLLQSNWDKESASDPDRFCPREARARERSEWNPNRLRG
jgi:hypothetical protein